MSDGDKQKSKPNPQNIRFVDMWNKVNNIFCLHVHYFEDKNITELSYFVADFVPCVCTEQRLIFCSGNKCNMAAAVESLSWKHHQPPAFSLRQALLSWQHAMAQHLFGFSRMEGDCVSCEANHSVSPCSRRASWLDFLNILHVSRSTAETAPFSSWDSMWWVTTSNSSLCTVNNNISIFSLLLRRFHFLHFILVVVVYCHHILSGRSQSVIPAQDFATPSLTNLQSACKFLFFFTCQPKRQKSPRGRNHTSRDIIAYRWLCQTKTEKSKHKPLRAPLQSVLPQKTPKKTDNKLRETMHNIP